MTEHLRLPHTDDPFKLLGVTNTDNAVTIKAAYTKLIKLYKPEKAPIEFQRIRKAYEEAIKTVNLFDSNTGRVPISQSAIATVKSNTVKTRTDKSSNDTPSSFWFETATPLEKQRSHNKDDGTADFFEEDNLNIIIECLLKSVSNSNEDYDKREIKYKQCSGSWKVGEILRQELVWMCINGKIQTVQNFFQNEEVIKQAVVDKQIGEALTNVLDVLYWTHIDDAERINKQFGYTFSFGEDEEKHMESRLAARTWKLLDNPPVEIKRFLAAFQEVDDNTAKEILKDLRCYVENNLKAFLEFVERLEAVDPHLQMYCLKAFEKASWRTNLRFKSFNDKTVSEAAAKSLSTLIRQSRWAGWGIRTSFRLIFSIFLRITVAFYVVIFSYAVMKDSPILIPILSVFLIYILSRLPKMIWQAADKSSPKHKVNYRKRTRLAMAGIMWQHGLMPDTLSLWLETYHNKSQFCQEMKEYIAEDGGLLAVSMTSRLLIDKEYQ